MRQIVERNDQRPTVHLGLVDLLGAVIKPCRVAKADCVCRCKQAEGWMRAHHAALIEQGQAARGFEHALDDEHHIRATGVIFVEDERDIVLIGPGQDTIAKFGDLHAVLDDNGVLADQIDTRNMAVEVDTHAWPVEAGSDLFNVGRFARAMIAGNHDAAVVGKAGQNGQRRVAVKEVIGIDFGNMFAAFGIGRDHQVRIDIEHLPDGNFRVRHIVCHSHSSGDAARPQRISVFPRSVRVARCQPQQ